jgi:hypothetical protein
MGEAMNENPYQPPRQQGSQSPLPRRGLLFSFCATFTVTLTINAALLIAEWRELKNPSPLPPNVLEEIVNLPEGLLLLFNLPAWPLMAFLSLRCLGFSGQSNSLFFKEKEGPSDGSQQEKGTCQRASHFLG